MRGAFGLLALLIAMAIGMFIYSRQAQSVSGSAPNANPRNDGQCDWSEERPDCNR